MGPIYVPFQGTKMTGHAWALENLISAEASSWAGITGRPEPEPCISPLSGGLALWMTSFSLEVVKLSCNRAPIGTG